MLTPREQLKTELEEFEALLDDGEPSDPQPIHRHMDNRFSSTPQSSIKRFFSITQHCIASSKNLTRKSPKILINPTLKLETEGDSARNRAKDFEMRGPSLSGILPPLNDAKSESRKKSILSFS